MNELRIVSFLPAATEMVCALGLEEQLVGISHECDFPPSVRTKPVVVRPVLPLATMSLREIDAAVAARIGFGASLYRIDEQKLRELAPTHILTQDLCQVCAPSGNEVTQVLKTLRPAPEILWLTPRSLEGVEAKLRELGRATGREAEASALVASGRVRLERVATLTGSAGRRPRVFCAEWVDPIYCSGHWMAELVDRAGGIDALSRRGADSVRISWEDVVRWAPEVLVVMPCGFHLRPAVEQAALLATLPGWSTLPAVLQKRVFAVDANGYFARPGPRLIDGAELLAHLFHPELVTWRDSPDAFAPVECASPPAPVWKPFPSSAPRQKRCPRCGAAFACGPSAESGKCWCDALPPLTPGSDGTCDCLCPACLRSAIARDRFSSL